MILWHKTKEKFNTDKNHTTTKMSVVVACDKCRKETTRVYSSYKQTIKKNNGKYLCHNCAVNNKKFREECSKRAKKKWQDEDYKEKNLKTIKSDIYREKKRQQSIELWQNEDYLSKRLSNKVIDTISKKSSEGVKKKWRDKEYRTKITNSIKERMIKQWRNKDYQRHMKESQSHITNEMWERGVFDNCFGAEFSKKMVPINQEILSRPDVKARLSKASKKNWENEDYRNAVIEGNKEKWQDDDYRKKMAVIRANQPRVSSIQIMLYNYLDDLNVKYYKESEKTVIGYYAFDCLIPRQNGRDILIECQGDYWHSLNENIRNDKAKFTYINKYFPEYEIMYVWEHEFYTKCGVLDRLKHKLEIKTVINDFNFNDVDVHVINAGQTKEFLNLYHYIGKGRGGKTIGAFLNNEMIGCVVYSSPLRQNSAKQFNVKSFVELSRFCIHPLYHKKNFASWLIAKSIRIANIDELIVAYADTTVGHNGGIYKAANFREHHVVDPDYWYVDDNNYVMHKRTLYGRAKKMSMTEKKFAAKFGYHKKFGGNKICYIFEQI